MGLALAAASCVLSGVTALPAHGQGLDYALVQAHGDVMLHGADGVVEAVRDTTVSAQVPGAVVQLLVRVGDQVRAGQELLRLDAQAARQTAAASAAQVDAARTQAQLADSELARQRQLFARQYISQAGLERAQAQAQAAHAQVRAVQAQSGAAAAQTGLHVVRAPYSGVVSEVHVALGDMATPGRPLARLYDPAALRVSATVPQALQLADGPAQLEVPSLGAGRMSVPAQGLQRLPTVDRATHTAQLRVALPADLAGAAPGMFARLWLPVARPAQGAASAPAALTVPASAVLRRGELTAVYVLDEEGRPRLRQVRLGDAPGGRADASARVPVLAGLRSGERVALDPQAAAQVR
ncbi:efflux RND transporter periplasmic adaptor subunit [Melaminivora suipulveris]|uniref:Efflux RND transporter periplasmic adaptor subunit n=1 Tax=Melaminivora suipulveris TaxID=2109913 RepID=A0A2R3Q899_9BURK|nr:efflux RND transporter periplasmic adaptor subunit [Melaminivora suipulveris]AVO47991.1 efflux RND transporter periplasmic adaptor subunit [Melaminivora suipulveris]